MNVVSAYILPCIIIILVIIAAISASKDNSWFRRFFRYAGYSLPVILAAWGVSTLMDGTLARSIKEAFLRLTAANHSLYLPASLLCSWLLILYYIQALADLINGMSEKDAELQTIRLREEYAMENMKIMRRKRRFFR